MFFRKNYNLAFSNKPTKLIYMCIYIYIYIIYIYIIYICIYTIYICIYTIYIYIIYIYTVTTCENICKIILLKGTWGQGSPPAFMSCFLNIFGVRNLCKVFRRFIQFSRSYEVSSFSIDVSDVIRTNRENISPLLFFASLGWFYDEKT